MSLNPPNCIGVASDNFDIYVETVTGRDILHDTVDIAYENSSSKTEQSVYLQAEDDQKEEVRTYIYKEIIVVACDGCQN